MPIEWLNFSFYCKKMLLDQVGLSLLLVEKYFEEVAKQKEKNCSIFV